MVELFTSRWSNRALETAPVVAVGISSGAPRFPLRYRYRRLPDLYPDGWMLGIEDDGRFERVYVAKLERLGVDRIAAQFTKISDQEGGKALALLCYEAQFGPKAAPCHRRLFAEHWYEKTGEVVNELHPDALEGVWTPFCVEGEKERGRDEPTLF